MKKRLTHNALHLVMGGLLFAAGVVFQRLHDDHHAR